MKMRRRKKQNSNPMEMSNELSENVMMIRNERFEETKRKKTSTKKEKRLCKNKCEYRFSLRGTDI